MATEYWTIVTAVRDEIRAGHYTETGLPPGPELAARFGVSSGTINRVFGELRREGLILTQQGRGSIVNPVPVIRRDAAARQRRDTREASGSRGAFDAELRAAGLDPRTETTTGRAVPHPAVAARLALAEGQEAVYRRRRMYAGPHPLQLATSWLPADIADSTPITEADPGPGGIYSRLEDLGHAPAGFTEDVDVRVPAEDEIRDLGLDPDHRVYDITRTVSDAQGRIVEVNRIIMPTHQWTLIYRWPAE